MADTAAIEPIWAVVTARIGSVRRRGKTMASIAGRPCLEHVVVRLRAVAELAGVVVATTVLPEDDVIRSWADEAAVPCYSGSPEDVLGRTLDAARTVGARTVVRVTGDCPLVDPLLVREVVEAYRRERPEYASNRLDGYTYPDGYDVEALGIDVLTELETVADDPYEREHVTPHVYRHPERYRLLGIEAPAALRRPDIHLSVDHEEDLRLVETIYEALAPRDPLFGVREVIAFLDAHPELAEPTREPTR